ncbi:hypothetical protein F4777DRAFT_584024 [Nemania sp. FL0916]|nr:hypothetical protein F4777DRAFT_584024 [Nemania sp. FL0916]
MTAPMPVNEPIAIIGSHCRFPGSANSPSRLWSLLKDPVDLSRKTPPGRWNADGFYHPNGEYHGATNAPKGYFLSDDQDDPRFFDASFFNITPKEAEAIDPQGKILLEVVYDALESAGITMQECNGERVGVFVGTMTSDYDQLTCKDAISTSQYCGTGLSRALLSNRVSYFYNWTGPSLTIDTACSSSLVAMHMAVGSLRAGDSALACVAGANIMVAPDAFMAESSLHMLSPNGYSRMWDESADGYARGEGVGVLFLKRLSQALADGDDIECVIRETGVNSDGRTLGITMPSSAAQAALIRDTYRRAGLDALNPLHRCQYFEAHGTGTQAGDPQEAGAIYSAFFGAQGDDSSIHFTGGGDGRLIVGSIKTVIGHTEGAAGVAGVMKCVLGLQNGFIPPNQHFVRPSPKVAPFLSRLQVPVELTPWPPVPPGHPQRASVNSFGFGGTNAHAILERYDPHIHGRPARQSLLQPAVGHHPSSSVCWTQASALPLLLSASTSKGLKRKMEDCLEYLWSVSDAGTMRAALGTLALHRSAHAFKIAFPAGSPEQLIQQLRVKVAEHSEGQKGEIGTRSTNTNSPRVLGIFTGQGAQWPAMGKELVWSSVIFRTSLQAMDAALKECADPPAWSLVDELLAPAQRSQIHEAALSQPLCTAVQVALVDVLWSAGVRFSAVLGHSSGEIAATYARGLINAKEAVLLAYYRGLHAKMASGANGEKGGMMAVGMGVEEAYGLCERPEYRERLFVAASNAPASVTLSGDLEALDKAQEELDEAKTFCRRLKVDTAYHSHHMNKCAGPYVQSIEQCNITPNVVAKDGECLWISSVYGSVGSPTAKELSARYWRDNMVQPVLFSQAVARARDECGPLDVILEVGPHPALKGPVLQTLQDGRDGNKKATTPYFGLLRRNGSDLVALSEALGQVWCTAGAAAVDWTGYSHGMDSSVVSRRIVKGLPSYPWDHSQMHHRVPRAIRQYLQRPDPAHELLGVRSSDSSPLEHRWQNILKPKTLPWLRHHRFQGQCIVPAAAYCVMALDSGRAMAQGAPVRLVEIQDLVIHSGISMDEDDTEGVDALFSLCRDDDMADKRGPGTVLTGHFSLDWAPANADRPTKNAVTGRVEVHLDSPSASTALPPPTPFAFALTNAGLAEFYDSMADIGLSYTGPFRALTSLRRRHNFSLGQLDKPHREDTSSLGVRPALLDASFQTVFAAFAAPKDGSLWTAFLPQRIRRLRFNMAICEVQPDQTTSTIQVCASITNVQALSQIAPAAFTSNIEILNEQGQTEVQLEGLTVASLAAVSASDDRELYVHTLYRTDPWEGFDTSPSSNLSEALPVHHHLSSIVSGISHRHPRIRMLEVDLGGGCDGLSQAISAGLAPSHLSYIFATTDQVSKRRKSDTGAAHSQRTVHVILDTGASISNQLPCAERSDVVVLALHGQKAVSGCPHTMELPCVNDLISDIRHVMIPGGFLAIVWTHDSKGECKSGGRRNVSRMPLVADDLERRGYTLPLYQYTQEASGNSILVAQATNSVVSVLRSPLLSSGPITQLSGTVLLVGGKTALTKGLAENLANVISSHTTGCTQITTAASLAELGTLEPSDSALSDLRYIVMLADLDAPSLDVETLDGTKLRGLQRIFDGPGRHVLWLTQGFRDSNPVHAASVGLIRTIRAETPQLATQILDIDIGCHETDMSSPRGAAGPTAELAARVAEAFLRFAFAGEGHAGENDVLWTVESEIVLLDGGKAVLPRVLPVQNANDRANASRRAVFRTVDTSRSVVRLARSEDDGKRLVYVAECAKQAILPESAGGHVRVKALYVSSWAFSFEKKNTTHLHVGVGIAASTGKTVMFASHENTSHVIVPRAWTLEIDMADGDMAPFASLLTRVFLSQGIRRDVLGLYRSVLIHEADEAFARTLNSTLQADCLDGVAVEYSTTDEKKLLTGGGGQLRFVHPQSTRRAVRAAFSSSRIDAIADFSVALNAKDMAALEEPMGFSFTPLQRNDAPVSAHAFSSDTIMIQIPACPTCAGSELPNSSAVAASLLDARHCAETVLASLAGDSAPIYTSAIPINNLIGSETSSVFGVVDWASSEQISALVRPINPASIFASSGTYLLVGLTGELGESLCRFMIDHGARNIVVASRQPQKAEHWVLDIESSTGVDDVNIHLVVLDVTDIDAVRNLKTDLVRAGMPLVTGVVNGAMLLNDGLFANMTIDSLLSTLRPKVVGSSNLDQVFADENLDFFIMFSSLVCLTGNRGQANYSAANMYMAGLAANRRKRGLVASVVDIGMVIGIGYAQRVDGTGVYENLRRQGYLPISEKDVHHMFVEAIAAGKPDFFHDPGPFHLSAGLQRFNVTSSPTPLPWNTDPRFSHHTSQSASHSQDSASEQHISTVTAQGLAKLSALEDIADVLTGAFSAQLESMLGLPADSIDAASPIIDLGVDSLVAVEVRSWFLKTVERDMPVLKVLGGFSVADLCSEVAADILASQQAKAAVVDNTTSTDADSTSPSHSTLFDQNIVVTGTPSSWTDFSSNDAGGGDQGDDDDCCVRYDEIGRMSLNQSRMWFPYMLLDDKTTYNCTTSYRLKGPLDVARFESALMAVTHSHQSFRTSFYTDPITGQPMQAVAPSSIFRLRKLSTADDENDVKRETELIARHEFDLQTGDVFVATLLSHEPDYHTIVFGYHHIILDGVSWQLFLQELDRYYATPGARNTSVQTRADYVDFSVQQRAALTSEEVQRKRDFWKGIFGTATIAPMPLFPFSQATTRKPLSQYRTTEYQIMLEESLVVRIKNVATEHRSTSFHFYLAVLQVLLRRFLVGVEEICIGITDANRSDTAFMDTVGLLLDSLPLRLDLSAPAQGEGAGETFAERLRYTRDTVYSAIGNSGVPLEAILEDLAVKSSATAMPLFQSLVNYRMGALKHKAISDVKLEYLAYQDARHPFDFILTIDEEKDWGALTLSLQDYLYDEASADVFLETYVGLLNIFSSTPSSGVDIPHFIIPKSLTTTAERLGMGEDQSSSSWSSLTLPARLGQMTEEHSNDPAIIDGGLSYTYTDLSLLSNVLGSRLDKLGGVAGSRIGVFSGPCANAIICLVTILKLGAVYIPLDERNSDERLATIMSEANIDIIVYTHDDSASRVAELAAARSHPARRVRTLSVPSLPLKPDQQQHPRLPDFSEPDGLAFIMFTSGTTGKPKGIMLTHENMATRVRGAMERMGIIDRTTVLFQSALGFDASVAQIFYALASGGTAVVSSNRKEMSEVAGLMRDARVNFTLMSPSEYAALFRHGWNALASCSDWRVAMVGGEPFPPTFRSEFRKLQLEKLKVFNAYGPTEISVASNIGLVNYTDDSADEETRISIGRALSGYRVCLVDDDFRPVPIGFPGQIAVHGLAVSCGYVNNEVLTRSNFLDNLSAQSTIECPLPSPDGCQWYLTGDMARMSSDGSLVHMGRVDGDSQVKLRGIRIELSEVSGAVLKASHGVLSQAATSVRGNNESQFLVTHVIFATGRRPTECDRYLERLVADLPLPPYMRPARAIPLPSLPVTSNGKVDMQALRLLSLSSSSANPITSPPRMQEDDADKPQEGDDEAWTPLELSLRQVWENILGHDQGLLPLSRDSGFFSAGGNSLSLLRLQAEMRKTFGVDVPLPELFRANSLSSLAQRLMSSMSNGSAARYKTTTTTHTQMAADAPFKHLDWAVETAIPDSISSITRRGGDPPAGITEQPRCPPAITDIILTGATGFLGRAIVAALSSRPQIQRIHCIAVRDTTSAYAVGLLSKHHPKVRVYAGDLSHPRLGLREADASRIFSKPGSAIVHNGADVSFMKPYEVLRATNVFATHELARLSLSIGSFSPPIPIHYVSTAGVNLLIPSSTSSASTSPSLSRADAPIAATSLAAYPPDNARTPPHIDGYVASKWVSEVFLEALSSATGTHVHIYRPSSITGTGAPALDIMQNVLSFSRTVGAVPDTEGWSGSFDFVDVHTVSRAIVDRVVGEASGTETAPSRFEVAHLTGDEVVPVAGMRAHMERGSGMALRELPMSEWVEEAQGAGLHPLVGTYLLSTSTTTTAPPVFPALKSSIH